MPEGDEEDGCKEEEIEKTARAGIRQPSLLRA
jgi:hypothetical protein